LADGVREQVKEKYSKLPASIEGTPESGWMLMDYGDTVVHIFQQDKRNYYDLEGMWRSAHVLLQIQ